MTDVIDLSQRRAERDVDPEFRLKDDHGRPMGVFLVDFDMNGKVWSTRIIAYDWSDAEARLSGIRLTGRVAGQLCAEVPL
jgi:hypothetical protein